LEQSKNAVLNSLAACNVIVRSRILADLKKRLKKAHIKWEETVSEHFFDQMNLAQLILYGGPAPTRGAIAPKTLTGEPITSFRRKKTIDIGIVSDMFE
jgi:hypothetical protein